MREFSSGKEFGLPPIGTSGINESAPKNDSTRSAFPALATKGSVFSWTPSLSLLVFETPVTGSKTYTVNLRNNTATGGVSVDVPTWAAGCVISPSMFVNTLGTSTFFSWWVTSPSTGGGNLLYGRERNSVNLSTADIGQLIVPFFDEATFTANFSTNGTGNATLVVYLVGFVRNV